MNRAFRWWVFACLAVGVASACGDDDGGDASPSCEAGTERCECDSHDQCEVGLRCLSGRCVRRGGPTETGGSSPTGAAGEDSTEGGAASGGRAGSSSGGTSSGGAPSATGGTTPSGDEGGSAGIGAVNGDGGTLSVADAGEGGVAPAAVDGGSGGEAGGMTTGGAPSTGGTAPSTGGSSPTGGTGSSGDATFSDDFEDGNAAGWDATSWVVSSDGGNQVLRQNPDYAGPTVPAKAASSITGDRRMEVRFKFTQISGVSYAALGADFETADDRDQLLIASTGEGTLLSARGGTLTTDSFTATIVANTWYRMAFEIDGTTLRGYFEGALVAELPNVTDIRDGVALTANQNGDLLYDDVSVCAGSGC